MALLNPDSLFKKIPTATTTARQIVLSQLQTIDPFEAYLIPDTANFVEAEALLAIGVKPHMMFAYSTSLQVSIVGCVLDATKNLDLFKVSGECRKLLKGLPKDTKAQQAASLLYALQWESFDVSKEFFLWQRRELEANRDEIVAKQAHTLELMAAKLAGITFEVRTADLATHPVLHQEKAFIWYTPNVGNVPKPSKMVKWDRPEPLKRATVLALLQVHLESAATSLIHVSERLGLEGWHTLLIEQNSQYLRTLTLCNKPFKEDISLRPKPKGIPEAVYPVFDNHPLTPESEVRLVATDRPMAMYFYDLFIKGLGMPAAEAYYLLVIDGQVAGVTGLHFSMWRTKRQPIFTDVFAVSMAEDKYRLGRLMTHLLCTREIAESITMEQYPSQTLNTRLEIYQTTFLSPSPSIMKVRGIMKLRNREEMPNGMYKLVYFTTLKPQSSKQVFHEWLKDQKQ